MWRLARRQERGQLSLNALSHHAKHGFRQGSASASPASAFPLNLYKSASSPKHSRLLLLSSSNINAHHLRHTTSFIFHLTSLYDFPSNYPLTPTSKCHQRPQQRRSPPARPPPPRHPLRRRKLARRPLPLARRRSAPRPARRLTLHTSTKVRSISSQSRVFPHRDASISHK